MSSVYNLEPPTKGKVVVKTTLGDIDIELWPKEAPKAVRNFVQLCMEGYYIGTPFHRVIKDFMVQGGDPTGSGQGGESIYGEPFKDEFHSRIKFNHRGLVACANESVPHSNGSQFFITLEACPHLDRKHTIFGKVVGDSIYNVAHFNELNVDDNDRPFDLPRFLDAEVLWSPFEDIVPRITKEERAARVAADLEKAAKLAKQGRGKRKKNLGLLSFGEEAGEEDAEADINAPRIRSAFDADMQDERLVKGGTEEAAKLAALDAAEEAERQRKRDFVRAQLAKQRPREPESVETVSDDEDAPGPSGQGVGDDFAAKMRARAMDQRQKYATALPAAEAPEEDRDAGGNGPSGGDGGGKKKKKEKRDRYQEALDSGKIKAAHVKPSKLLSQQDTDLMSEFEKKRKEALERSRLAKEKGNNFSKLMAFKKRLAGGGGAAAASHAEVVAALPDAKRLKIGKEKSQEGPDMNLPGAWRVDNFLDDYEDEKLDSLRTHKLEFAKAPVRSDAMAVNNDDDYKVEDPLALRGEVWDAKAGAEKRRNRAWAANTDGPVA